MIADSSNAHSESPGSAPAFYEDEQWIADLIRKIGDSPTLVIAERVTDGHGTRDDIDYLIACLSRHGEVSWRERCLAAWSLGHLVPDDRGTRSARTGLKSIIQCRSTYEPWRAAYSRRISLTLGSHGRVAGVLCALACFALALSVVIAMVGSIYPGSLATLGLMVVGLLGAAAAGGCILLILLSVVVTSLCYLSYPIAFPIIVHHENRVRATAIWALGQIGGISDIYSVARAATDLNGTVSKAAMRVLSELLPLVNDETESALDLSTAKWLAAVLPLGNSALTCELLRVLGYVGGPREIADVRSWTIAPSTSATSIAAREALARIETRIRQATDERILLRPSAQDNSEILLRPAANVASNPEQLLRPVDNRS